MISIDDTNHSFLVAPRSNADKASSTSPPILSGLGGVASLCPARPCVSLLYSRVAPGLRSYLSPVRECCSCSRTHGAGGGARGAGLGRVRCTSRPSVRLSVLPPLPPFRVLPRASRAVHLPRPPFSLPPHRPRRLLPLSKSPLASHMDTRGRVRLHRRVCASPLLCLCLLFPFILREKRRYDTIFGQRDSRETDGFLVGNVELTSRV